MAVDFQFLRGGYSVPPGNAVDFDGALMQDNGWAGLARLSFTLSQPVLVDSIWEAEAALDFLCSATLSDSNWIGEGTATLSLQAIGALAPSWYIRRPLAADIGTPWSKQQRIGRSITAPHTQAARNERENTCPWGDLAELTHEVSGPWATIPRLEASTTSPWKELATKPQADIGCDYSHPAIKQRDRLVLPWGDMAQRVADIAAGYDPTPEVKNTHKALPWDSFESLNKALDLPYSHPERKDVEKPIISGPYWYPRWCLRVFTPPRGDQLVFDFPAQSYSAPAGNALVFDYDSSSHTQICYDGTWNGPKDAYWYQPHDDWVIEETTPGRYHIIMNSYSLKRVSDNVNIPIMDLAVSTDIDSWCWKLTANLRRKGDLDLVRPVQGSPVEVEATINGNVFRFIVETYGENGQFAQHGYSITGRSLSAYLAAPYSLPTSLLQASERTAAQLAAEAIDGSGFTAVMSLTDWIVPANAYSVTNKTPMQQLLTIAAAAGGVVQSDPAAQTVILMPWYKYLPWTWADRTPDFTLPTYKTKSTSYQATPPYTGVYTSGQTQGVICLVKRSGTDGSDQPQMVTDPLITATEAGLQRGQRILADSGHRASVSLTAPLFDDPGLLTPGLLIDVVDSDETWRGMITSCRITASRGAKGAIVIRQVNDVLRYYGS